MYWQENTHSTRVRFLMKSSAMKRPFVSLVLWVTTFTSVMLEEEGETPSTTLKLRLHPPRVSIVLVGGQSTINVQCAFPTPEFRLRAHPRNPVLVKMLNGDVLLNSSNSAMTKMKHSGLELLGRRPGRTQLDLFLVFAQNRSVARELSWDFEVIVVERVNAFKDGFLYLLLAAQMATLVMIALRMRGAAIKEALYRPCALFSAIFCQAILVPLVSIGVSVALGLPIHSVVCLLILGCCPTGPHIPMLTVVQQGHVELAVILTLIETCAAFGIMPLWLFAYGNFLGLAYDHVSAPYYFIAGALVLVATPLLLGFIMQRVAPGSSRPLDRAIPPTCLLLMLLQFTVNATAFASTWDLVTWRLLAGSGLVPVLGGILGTIGSATFRQELPQTKCVTIATCVQNTILAKVIIQMSYPVPDASVMVLTLTCVDFFTTCYMLMGYVPHLCLTLCWPAYRPLHQHAGIGGHQDSIGDRIVRSMVKAGEITFGKLQQSPAFKRVMGSDAMSSSQGDGNFTNFGSLKGRLMYTGSTMDSAYRSGISSGSRSTTPTGFPLKYFTDSTPEFPERTAGQSLCVDSLESLDYEMLDTGDEQVKEDLEEKQAAEGNREMPGSPWTGKRMMPCFDSLDVRKPLPPLPLPPTPPYLSRRISCSDEALNRSDSRVSYTRAMLPSTGRCARMRHTSVTSSKSVRSDATQDTSVSSRQGDVNDVDDVDDVEDDESVSTIMASYDMSIAAAMTSGPCTVGTRWRWDAGHGDQYSPPPPNVSPARPVTYDLSSIEEEQSLDNSCRSDSHRSNLHHVLHEHNVNKQ